MNAVKLRELIDLYLDVTRNARFKPEDYSKAVNEAIEKFLDDMFGDLELKKVYGFQRFQQIRDNVYTLIKTHTPTVTASSTKTTRYGSFTINHINNPTDYRELVQIETSIAGVVSYAKPTSYNEIGPLMEDSFKMPSNVQIYYNDDSTGYLLYRGVGGTLTVIMTYVKEPAEYSLGTEAQLINSGAGVLTIGQVYIATETSVHNSITYLPGSEFTAANANLTSGQVILKSNTTACDLPEKVQNEVAKIAAQIMSGVVSDFNRSAFVNKEAGLG